MAKLSVIRCADVEATDAYPAPRTTSGSISARVVTPPDYSLWAIDAELADGATLGWSGVHGDDAVYALEGELDVDGRRCPTGGVVIVEADVTATVRAIGQTRTVHFGSADGTSPCGGPFGPAHPDGRGVHVYGPRGAFESGERDGVHAVWFADGTCATCRLQMLKVVAPPTHVGSGKRHSHSQDEIIYVVEGSITMGACHLDPYTALCVPGNAAYALISGSRGHSFLNFRPDVSEVTYSRNSDPVRETALSRGGRVTGDVR